MEEQKAIVFDYKTARVKRETETMLTDAYATLGWEVTATTMADASLSYINVSFKRDRKIAHKAELNHLQTKLDGCIAKIEKLTAAQKNAGLPEALTIGTVGAVALGGGISMAVALEGVGFIVGGVMLGVVGIALGLLGWLVHGKVKKKKLAKLEPAIAEEYDKVSSACEEAAELSAYKGTNA